MLQGKISSDVVSKRQQYLNGIKKVLESQKEKLQNAIDTLGLDLSSLQEAPRKQVCPFNSDHVVPEQAFKKHCEECRLLSAGTQRNELAAQLQNLDFAYENKESVMRIDVDESVLNKVIWDSCVQNGQVYTGHRRMPQNHIEENILLTPEDRLALYHYIVRKSHEAGKVLPVDRHDDLLTTDWGSLVKKGLLDEQNNQQFGSKLEQLAALRDLKRRRQSYRAKNVHITKKTYTEIIREVIVNQMEILAPSGSQGAELRSANGERQPCSDPNQHPLDMSMESGSREYRQGDREGRRSRDERDRSTRDDRDRSTRDDKDWSKTSKREDRRSRERRHKDSRSSSYSRHRKQDTPGELGLDSVKLEMEDGEVQEGGPSGGSSSRADLPVSETGKSSGSRKRSVSPSGSDSSEGRSRKSKKSKHKKKHSKKHKRRD